MQKLGQHFLTNTAIAKRIVHAAGIKPTDIILEIGPGRGMLTQFLVKKAQRVIAVEKDKNLAAYLNKTFSDSKNIEILCGDILTLGNSRTSSEYIPKTYAIVANIPYYITSKVLRVFLEEVKNKPQAMTLMVQKEVAERICAKPPRMNLLALSVQAFGKPKIVCTVKRGSFSPPPEVDSAVIKITHISDAFFIRRHISPQKFFTLPKKAFSQKRKMLRSSIKVSGNTPGNLSTKRPQELSLDDWTTLLKTKE
jgi:16S rRNA (adenine1518-N6/adenine1519-N6)-dimethyltransferase